MYGQEVMETDCKSAAIRPQSLTERLEQEKTHLEQRLEEINGVLGSLEASPETKDILDAVARLGHLHY